MSPQPVVRIGTRASKLALAQSGMMQRRIAAALLGTSDAAPEGRAEDVAPLIHITTTGDRIQDRRLLEVGGKALFTKEIEEALLDGRIDAAIHSMKDVPAEMPPGLAIAAIPEREDPRDAFVSERFDTLAGLPH
ncbi:MAG: hydroxymethylbilane synthase, partial [Caulobacter sp.]|nr:hydroxymethylbilane synthase [Caulobacter sp.]